jgi:hypothetical protein
MFSEQEVIAEVRKTYKKSICLDRLDEACRCKTLQKAADVIIMDSDYWD